MKQKGLGRGLDAIFGTENIAAKVAPMSHMAQIAIEQIVPNPTQPRTAFDEADELPAVAFGVVTHGAAGKADDVGVGQPIEIGRVLQ